MEINKEYLQGLLQDVQKNKELAIANLNASNGAIQLLERLLADLVKDDSKDIPNG